MDDIFNALAHPIRRDLLDRLRERDGQTLGELERDQPVTRFGVMKHLGVLESAHLIVTRKVGREKLHYLNPLPIQEVADRWVSRFAAPFARTLSDLATAAETRDRTMGAAAPKHVWEMYIRATPEAVWSILTDDEQTPLWQHFNMTSKTEWTEGGAITFLVGDRPMIVGKVVAIEPPRRFVHTFSAQWSPDVAVDPASRVTWTLEPVGDKACKLTLTHDDFGGETATSKAITGGWPEALSRLKTLAETGEPFHMPPPAMAG
ncbi:SRPBCC domain-containing protein [Ciceribacter sp. L1K23]|uniref:ArsR/SmtB family transcription factor n=1 Tax=Ciceribacter sp. L1K23 TaxID=2820276 RepID=UPI001B816035|nr:SRPBCC domain-containing protein [Ciceribacter sp. L1K23]MBR0555132.1 SRPBCC domain-containing protein [Ciceribacter sp. L1K23]